jgi:hypothetical protein
LVILIGSWQIINVVAAAAQLWSWNRERTLYQDIARGSQFPPVIWWIAKLRRKERTPISRQTRRVIFIVIRGFQLAIVAYGIITIEGTVTANGIESSENQWGFGQIAALVNLLGTAGLVSYRLLRSLALLGLPKMYVAESADSDSRFFGQILLPFWIVVSVCCMLSVGWKLFMMVDLNWCFEFVLEKLNPDSFLGWVGAVFVFGAAIVADWMTFAGLAVLAFLTLYTVMFLGAGIHWVAIRLRSTKTLKTHSDL